jgi:hypothetical protein
MAMRKQVAALVLVAFMLGRAMPARAVSGGEEAGLAVGAAALNLIYLPAKIVVAVGGFILGAATGFATGGDTRAAYGIWVPTLSGTYFLRPAHMEGTAPIEFLGTDYADRPSSIPASADGGVVYEGLYKSK